MYTTSRTAQAGNDLPGAIGFAVDIADTVENATGVPVSVWTGLYGAPMGTIVWSSQVESFATIASVGQKLEESADYLEKVAGAGASGLFITGSLENRLANVVHQAGTPGAIEYVSTLTATTNLGRAADAMAFGVEMADFVNGLTGSAVSFAVNTFSTVGQVTWFAGYEDASAVDDAQAAIAASAEYAERASGAADLFVPGTGEMVLAQRLK